MTTAELNKLMLTLHHMEESQLRHLNDGIIAELKQRLSEKRARAVGSFVKGQKVKFYSKKQCRLVVGTITKVNTKNIKLVSEQGENWIVASTLLEVA